ncbi:MAG: CbtB-domain containing protein [Tistlia sp.]|uniref:CbtB domain-containing protein n=1 Tax=Tistlia sp. TaxID=3057121 RepID=UPI0034A0ED50
MSYSTETARTGSMERAQAAVPAAVAILLGLFLVFGVGFANPATIHNAAHDSRHSFAFPCH